MSARAPRLFTFGLGVAGGLVVGLGALVTWRTTDFANGITTIKGTDTVWGLITLGLAVLSIVAVLSARVADTDQPRTWAAVAPLPAGIAVAVVGALAWPVEGFVYGDDLTAAMREVARQTGEILTRGPGPGLLIGGGALLMASGVAGIIWVRAWNHHPETTGSPAEQADQDA